MLGPVTARVQKLDSSGWPIPGVDGTPQAERRLVGVKPVSVFDVSQTDGDPPAEQPEAKLNGQAPPGLWEEPQLLVEGQGFTVPPR